MLAVASEGAGGPLLSHIPFVVAEGGGAVHAHLVRSNPIARCLLAGERQGGARGERTGRLRLSRLVRGGAADQVPTWNYIAVHLRGTLRLRPEETLHAHLDALSARFEHDLRPKPPWRISKVPEAHLARLMRAIMPIELAVEAVDGTWKLNQTKTDEIRLRAAEHVGTEGFGQETARLAQLMRNLPDAG